MRSVLLRRTRRTAQRQSSGYSTAIRRSWRRSRRNGFAQSLRLRDYHRQPEYKFLGGGWNEEGTLRRRHIFVDTIEDIGKESDGWEEDEARSEKIRTRRSFTRHRRSIATGWPSSSSRLESGS